MDIPPKKIKSEQTEQLVKWEKDFLSNKSVILYKYRGDIYRDILTLKNNQIYIPTLEQLNDPNESCLSMYSVFKDLKLMQKNMIAIPKIYEQAGMELPETMEEQILDCIKDVDQVEKGLQVLYDNGYFSLCKRNNIECLWSYYGNSHKGFCIGYDVNELIKTLKYKCIFEVKYTLDRLAPKGEELSEMLKDPITFLRDVTASKSKAWEKEEEVRIVSYDYGYIDIIPSAIRSIYIGAKCSDSDKKLIIRSLKDRKIDFYQMKFKHDSFTMVSELIET